MTDEVLPLIGIIAKLELKPTDIVVVKSRGPISLVTANRIEGFVRIALERCDLSNKVIVLDDLDLSVISPPEGISA